jgi:hypothetical protein
VKNLKYLEVTKLLKELDFIKSDLEFKSQLIRNVDGEFQESVSHFLEKHPHLKRVWENDVKGKPIQDEVEDYKESEEVVDEETSEHNEISESTEIIDERIKGLYRQIVKVTHPDKIGTHSLKNYLSEANKAYKEGNFLKIIDICTKLDIDYNLEDDDINSIGEEIKKLKSRLKFIETTYPYQWWIERNESAKSGVILTYIQKQLIKES